MVQNEIRKQLSIFGEDKLPAVDRINEEDFDKEVYDQTTEFLNAIQSVYNNRRRKAKDELDAYYDKQMSSPELEAKFLEMRGKFENERIGVMVKNIQAKKRAVRSGDELVQRIYPVYATNEHPDHALDFRTNFYYPEKYLAGSYIDTKIFNVLVIWSMTIVLFIAVYYDWLRKILKAGKF